MSTTRAPRCWMGRREFFGYDRDAVPACTHGGHDDFGEAQGCAMGFPDATCLLEAGHRGEHEWTPDDEIVITFAPVSEAP